MKTLIKGRFRIIFISAAILVVSSAAFIACTQITMGSEESAVISQQSTYAASNSPESKSAVTPEKPELIDKQDALESFKRMSNEVFGLSVDEKLLNVVLNEYVNPEGSGVTHYTWDIICRDQPNKYCSVDAVTGTVISFNLIWSGSYPGHPATYPSSMKSGDFTSEYAQSILESPDNIYIIKVLDIVTSKLADGRKILGYETSGIGFVSQENDENPETLGTVSADCKVYMDTGASYTLTFWGVPGDKIVLNALFTHPTKQACEFDYYYPDQTDHLPPNWRDYSKWPDDDTDS